jgi:WD40 repeat protein
MLSSSSRDQTIAFWDIGKGNKTHTLKGHENAVFSIAWSPDGKTLASGSADRTIRLWDSRGRPLKTIYDLPDSVQSLAFSPDGQLLATKLDHSVWIWRYDICKCIAIIPCAASTNYLPCLAFNPRESVLATLGERDRTIRLWDFDTDCLLSFAPRNLGGKVREMKEAQNSLIFFSYASEDGKDVATICDFVKENGFKIWIDKESLIPGQDWDYEINMAIDAASVCLVFISNYSVEKTGYVNKEIKKILDRMDTLPEGKILMIPIRLDSCPIPRRLKKWQVLDYFHPQFRERLISAIHHAI